MGSASQAAGLRAALGDSWSIEVHDSLPSTMDRAREISASPALFLALHQTAGRGRQGRVWEDTSADFAGTYVFSRQVEVAKLMGFSLAVGLTVRRALPEVPLKLKWPNDLYTADGRKLGGILIEVIQEPDPRVLIGIGVNLGARGHASGRAGVAEFLNPCPDPAELALRLSEPLRTAWKLFQSSGFPPLQHEFMQHAYGLGCQVAATEGTQRIEGVIQGVDAQGCLLVENSEGLHRLVNAHIESIKI